MQSIASTAPADAERRKNDRRRTLASAQIVFGGSAINCQILDMSPDGARLRFNSPVVVPAATTLRIRDGSTYPIYVCWNRGLECGVQFIGPPTSVANEQQVQRAAEAFAGLRSSGLGLSINLIRKERFFGDEELRAACEMAEQACVLLEEKLRPHVRIRHPTN